jgi:hypothetical protein
MMRLRSSHGRNDKATWLRQGWFALCPNFDDRMGNSSFEPSEVCLRKVSGVLLFQALIERGHLLLFNTELVHTDIPGLCT